MHYCCFWLTYTIFQCASSSHSSNVDSSDDSSWMEPVAELREISGEWCESDSPVANKMVSNYYKKQKQLYFQLICLDYFFLRSKPQLTI